MTDQNSTQAPARIFIPADTTALSVGADEVAKTILERAARDDVAVEIVRTGSRGMCWLEPFIEVDHPDGRIGYGPVTPADVASLFEKQFLTGGKHRLGHGLVELMDYLAKQDRVVFARAGVTRPESLDDYMDHGGMAARDAALEMQPQAIIDEVKASGLRGRGGAGFPTGITWQTVADAKGDSKYIVCNADEGDSGTFSDRLVMECDPFMLLEGMIIAGLAVGADTGFIYLRCEYPLAHTRLNAAIATLRADGWLGDDVAGRGKRFDIDVRLGAGAYICGEETALIESLEGKRGLPRARPPYPAQSGYLGRPTITQNVETLYWVAEIWRHGPEAYQAEQRPRFYSVSGRVRQPGVYLAPSNALVRELIEAADGMADGHSLHAFLPGGASGGVFPARMADLAMDFGVFEKFGGFVGSGALTVLSDADDVWDVARNLSRFFMEESCGQCTPCRVGTEKMLGLLNDPKANADLIRELSATMQDASICGLGQAAPNPVLCLLKYFEESAS